MESVANILQLSDREVALLAVELSDIDPKIPAKMSKLKTVAPVSNQHALEYVVVDNMELWAYVYLNWKARDYQKDILNEMNKSKAVALRLGRRLGKTDCMCINILYHACTQKNKGSNNQYDILIITPYEAQINLIFERLGQLIEGSPYLCDMVARSVQHCLEFKNGTGIQGFTAGVSLGSKGGNNTRGQRADLIVFDEVDYIGSVQISNILNIRNEDPTRIKIVAASTPSGAHNEFYRWCTDCSKSYSPSRSDIENFTFSGYNTITCEQQNRKGNGWVEIYAPSIVNRKILEINPDTQQSYLEDIRMELSELRFLQEVMAEFGDEEMGVYQKRFIRAAISEGNRINHKYYNEMSDQERELLLRKENIIVLGVDWDKFFIKKRTTPSS